MALDLRATVSPWLEDGTNIYQRVARNVCIGTGPTATDALSLCTSPVADATRALFNISNTALSGGSASGTFVGGNPLACAGDFLNLQVANAARAKLTCAGALTVVSSTNNLSIFAATTSAQLAGVLNDETGTGLAVFSIAPVFTSINNNLSIFAATTSAQLAGVISDETGSDLLVFSTSPSLTTPNIGAATATSINGLTITASTGTLTIANGKTLTASNTLTFTGTDGSSVAFSAGGTVAYTANKLSVFAATTSAELAGVISNETGSGLLVFGTSPTFTTSIYIDNSLSGADPTWRGNAIIDSGTTDAAANGVEFKSGNSSSGYGFRLATIIDSAGTGVDFLVQGRSNSATWTRWVSVNSTYGGIMWGSGSKPTCASAIRGTVYYVAGAAGVIDTFELCRKDAANAYAWVTLF